MQDKERQLSRWDVVPIGEVCEGIYDGPHATPPKTDSGPVFLGIWNLVNGRVDLSETEHVDDEFFKKWTRRVTPRAGDLVFSYETRLGDGAMIPEGLTCCLGRRMALARPDQHKVHPRFLLYSFLAPEFQDTIRKHTVQGSTVDRIPLLDFPKFLIRLPDRADQEAIAAVLGSLDDKIEQNRRTGAKLEGLARAVFKAWFVDFEPVKAKAAGATAFPGMPPKTFAALPNTFQDSPLGPVPQGWEVKPLSAICKLVSGGTPKRSEPSFWGGDVPWYSVKDAPASGMPWVYSTDEQITQKGLDESATNLVPIGCTIISARGTVGKLAMAGQEMAFNQSCYGLLPADGRSYRYLNLLTNETVLTLQQRTHGSVFETITRQTFDGIQVVVPPPELVETFDSSVAPIFELQLAQLKESTKLATLRDYLLPRLLSGRVRVKPASSEPVRSNPKETSNGKG